MDEAFWHQKSKVKWKIEGDRNTTFFHRVTKAKGPRNLISYLRNVTDIINDPTKMANHVVNYFSNIFCFANNCQSSNVLKDVILKLVDTNMNKLLTMIPSKEEIKMEVFNLNKNSTLGPDGF